MFFGGVPKERFRNSIKHLKIPFNVNLKFVGCLKSLYFNRINILYDLYHHKKSASYHSVFPQEFGCSPIDSLPITFPTNNSRLIFNNTKRTEIIRMSFEFKSVNNCGIISSGIIRSSNDTNRYWILFLNDSLANLCISDTIKIMDCKWTLTNNLKYLTHHWQHISFAINGKRDAEIISNHNFKISSKINLKDFHVIYYENISIGGDVSANYSNAGLRGCVRQIKINGEEMDSRIIMIQSNVIGKVSLDNCQLIDPCNVPNACEHGGKCLASLETGDFKCDCNKTGYSGKTCHFCKLCYSLITNNLMLTLYFFSTI